MLPVQSINNSTNVITYQSASSANFYYVFNGSQTTPLPGSNVGVFGSQYIADPNLSCVTPNKQNAFSSDFPDWLSTINGQIDLRGLMVTCVKNAAGTWSYNTILPTIDTLTTTSSYFGTPSNVAYTTESLFYAQSGYFVTVVMVQWSNVFACKSRKVIYLFYHFSVH
jgi:hypothetical protein